MVRFERRCFHRLKIIDLSPIEGKPNESADSERPLPVMLTAREAATAISLIAHHKKLIAPACDAYTTENNDESFDANADDDNSERMALELTLGDERILREVIDRFSCTKLVADAERCEFLVCEHEQHTMENYAAERGRS